MATSWELGLLLLLGGALLWLWRGTRRYGKVFAPAHYVEVAQGLRGLKAGALAHIEAEGEETPLTINDPRILRTSADLAIVYSISRRDTASDAASGTAPGAVSPPSLTWVHHLSVGMAGGFTPYAVGGTMIVYILQLLDVSMSQVVVEIAASRAFQAEFALGNDDEVAYAQRDILLPTLDEVRRIHRECLRRRDELQLGRLPRLNEG